MTTRRKFLALAGGTALCAPFIRHAYAMAVFTPTGGDDTAVLQAAISGAQSLSIEAGNSLISGVLHVDHPCEIIWRTGATLWPMHASCDVLSLESPEVRLVRPRIVSAVARTGGAFIRAAGANDLTIIGGLLKGYWKGVAVKNCTTLRIENLKCKGGVDGHGAAIVIDGGTDQKIDDLHTNAADGERPAVGVSVLATADLHISRSSIMAHGTCVSVTPPAGKEVASFWMDHTYLDTAFRGLTMNSAGSIVRTKLDHVWASSMTQQGILFKTTNGGTIDGVEADALHCFLNGHNGLQAEGNVKNVQIGSGKFGGNALSGIAIGAGPQNVSIESVRSGDTDGAGPNAGWGCIVYPSGQNHLRIQDNDFTGNTAGSLMDLSGAVTKSVGDNFV